MNVLRVLALVAALSVVPSLISEEEKSSPKLGYPVRVDILGRVKDSPMTVKRVHGPDGRSDGAYFQEATWRDDYKDDFLTCSFPSEKHEWTRGYMKFVPEGTGNVTLSFRGRWEKDEFGKHIEHWVMICGVTIEGGKGKNLDFKELEGEDSPAGWRGAKGLLQKKGGIKGANAVKVWFQSPVSQDISVEEGKAVTVEFWYCPVETKKQP